VADFYTEIQVMQPLYAGVTRGAQRQHRHALGDMKTGEKLYILVGSLGLRGI